MTSDQDTSSEPAPRRYYIEGQIRAGDLADGDVLNVPGHGWREVLDVWADEDADRVLADAEFTHDKELIGLVKHYLTGLGMYVLVRHLCEAPGTSEVPYKITSYRRCELVTIQVIDPTLPGTPHIERYPVLQRLLTEQQWPETRRTSPARKERS